MKVLEAFSPKELRTCSRIMNMFLEKHNVSDLSEILNIMQAKGLEGFGLTFSYQLNEKIKSNFKNGKMLLFAIGWRQLKTWFKILRLFKKYGVETSDVESFYRSERKKELNSSSHGWKKRG